MAGPDAPFVNVSSRAELREWLAANHATSATVWLVSPKRPNPGFIAYKDLVEELVCWGRIDSLPRAIGAQTSANLIAPTNPKSAWSAINKAHAERARAKGLMMHAGEAAIAVAQANGMWDFLNDVEALTVPPDLDTALTGQARAVWNSHPKSIKRAALEWIKTAKTPPPAPPGLPKWQTAQRRG